MVVRKDEVPFYSVSRFVYHRQRRVGRQSGRPHPLCDLMIDAGAWHAINFDGGGSATLCYWNETEKKTVIVNHDTKRPVGINLGLCIVKPQQGGLGSPSRLGNPPQRQMGTLPK